MAEPIGSKVSMPRFDLPGTGHALFTTRAHGNMSSVSGLDHERGFDARERLRAQLGLRRLARGYQVHGTTVVRIRPGAHIASSDSSTGRPVVEADGHATSMVGVGVMVLAADCLPVALGSEHGVAMVHAGWRGLAAGVLEEGVRALRELHHGEPGEGDEIVAVIGPGAGPCCYEVGPEVHAAFGPGERAAGVALVSDVPPVFGANPDSSVNPASGTNRAPGLPGARAAGEGSRIDLKALARERLQAAGVLDVRDVEVCTICDTRFYSHRRESTRAGRQAGIAWLE